jgi:hypothetical protein
MARKARFNLPGIPQHLIQRGNNREPCFYTTPGERKRERKRCQDRIGVRLSCPGFYGRFNEDTPSICSKCIGLT